jgi:DNA-binding CsgD family transcriptional regulator
MLDLANGTIYDGQIKVHTTVNRGMTPEEIADIAIERIISIGQDSHPAIREQALAYKEYIYQQLVSALKQAVRSDRTTLANRLRDAGHPELTKILEI